MIILDSILRTAINPALAMLPVKMDNDAARVMLLSIGQQETRLCFRFQKIGGDPYAKGPARGLWQMERGGGVAGVMHHPATKDLALDLCRARSVPWDGDQVHASLEFDDILAAGFARLLLWTDTHPLPDVDASHEDAWGCYTAVWRPGKPRRETWDAYHAAARAQVMA